MLRIVASILALLFACGAGARPLTEAERMADFQYLVGVINANYGPLEYKTANKVVDISQLTAQFESKIRGATSNDDFYYSMIEYVSAYRDGHFGISVPSNQVYRLPITADLVQGKILITKIDTTALSATAFPFQAGDEIVKLDEMSAAEYLDWASRYVTSGNPRTVRRIAAWTAFFRRGSRLPLPTKDNIQLSIRRGTSEVVENVTVPWTKEGDGPDKKIDFLPADLKPLAVPGMTASGLNFDNLSNTSFQDYINPVADRDYACNGITRVAIPADATKIMTEPFTAYYHPTPKGNIGYLRIPHYSPRPPKDKPDQPRIVTHLEWFSQYEFAIRELEKNTVALVIDQDHNCGGSVWLVHKMISLFMDKPFKSADFELLANRESVSQFSEWVSETAPGTIDRENVERVISLIRDTWNKGTSRLTPKTPIDGAATFEPNGIRYTKPVVILIDEIAGSGGDMFPSMMKGLGRAKLFGQTTAGLGGHVQEYPAALPYSQMTFRITKSLFFRPDGVAIENNGAVPDQVYDVTRDDTLYGFKEYQKAYLDYLSSMIGN